MVPTMTAKQAYETRVTKAREALTALDRRGAMIANFRTVTFLGSGALLGLVIFERVPRLGVLPGLLLFAGYVALAVIHSGILRDEDRWRVLLGLNERGLARLEGRWHDFADQGQHLVADEHLYAADLDVVGKGSLFQRLDETGTRQGEATLGAWLLAPAPDAHTIRERQGCVRELGPEVDFRQALIAEAKMAGKEKADPSRFIAWAEAPSALTAIRWGFPLAHLLPPFTIISGLLSANELLPGWPFAVGLALQIAVVFATRKPIAALWDAVTLSERGFVRFEETFKAIDAQRFEHPALLALQRGLQEGPTVSSRLRGFSRLLGFAELKHSGQLHPIINALTLWDLLVLFRLDRWREIHGRGVRGWFEALARLEALSAFATWTFERPDDVFPEVGDDEVSLTATALGHPLLEVPVRNDVTLPGPGSALVITGSNMSGKTTLMRAMGLNAVMALAGLPVCARAMRCSRAQVMTSMRLKDSLERGVSYFYAEVQRIKTLLTTAQAHPSRCLFLLDELFMGTNTRERQIASRALMVMLLDTGAAGAVATHDLSICELARERPAKLRNVHFRDLERDGEMTFDYTLREGVVETTNALEVLRRAGVPISG
jgi:hypothetical protein